MTGWLGPELAMWALPFCQCSAVTRWWCLGGLMATPTLPVQGLASLSSFMQILVSQDAWDRGTSCYLKMLLPFSTFSLKNATKTTFPEIARYRKKSAKQVLNFRFAKKNNLLFLFIDHFNVGLNTSYRPCVKTGALKT